MTKALTAVLSGEGNYSGFRFRYRPPSVFPTLSLPPLVLLPPGPMLVVTSMAFRAGIDAERVHQLLPLPGVMVALVAVGLFAGRSPRWRAGEDVVCPCSSCPEVTVLARVGWERPTVGTNVPPVKLLALVLLAFQH